MSRRKPTEPEGQELDRRFEGRARLQALLEKAAVLADADDVAEAFRQAQKDGVPAATVISALFEDEPKFGNPKDARALYGNLFGLWELLASGAAVDLSAPRERPKPPPPPPRPGRFVAEGPDDAWVEGAWRWLEAARPRELQPLQHAFDHRTDSLVTWLDAQGLSELGFAFSQHLLFELFAMLELGSSKGIGGITPPEGSAASTPLPPALTAYVDEAVFEAEQDEDEPLAEEEGARLRLSMARALEQLWRARKE